MASKNMPDIFGKLCGFLGVPKARMEQLIRDNSAVKTNRRRSLSPSHSIRRDFAATDGLTLDDFHGATRQHRKRQATGPPAVIQSADQLKLAPSLTCRGKLYTDPELQPLNRPIYIATDSHSPLQDRNLAVFFNSLPCVFVLTDFAEVTPVSSEPIADLVEMTSLRNLEDGVKLGSLLFPFLEAEIIGRSRMATIGTPGSTFSGALRLCCWLCI
jgi:hypothetical protein